MLQKRSWPRPLCREEAQKKPALPSEHRQITSLSARRPFPNLPKTVLGTYWEPGFYRAKCVLGSRREGQIVTLGIALCVSVDVVIVKLGLFTELGQELLSGQLDLVVALTLLAQFVAQLVEFFRILRLLTSSP